MFRNAIGAVFGLALFGATGTAHATTVIDTTSSDVDTNFSFGVPQLATYGQTLLNLSGPDTVLNSFSLYLRQRSFGSGTLDLRGYVAEWDGAKASNILFESATQTMNAAGSLQEFAFNTGSLNLTAGGDYVFFLSISHLAAQSNNQFGVPIAGGVLNNAGYVFLNNGTNYSALTTSTWGTADDLGPEGHDMFFKASFSSPNEVPLPAAAPLFAVGLGAMALVGRRRKRKASAATAAA